jgi:predicted extracellular nuclease
VVINEIMQNPAAVGDSSGEWFELHNPSGIAVDIEGWTIQDNDSDSHVIANGGPLIVPAGGFLVLGNNTDSGTNGGATVDYNYGGSFFLGNSADELVLLDGGLVEWDRVEWDGGPAFPDPTGASMSLVDPALDNNVGENWCESPTPFGDGDLGTPGAANNCGALPPPVCGADDTVTLISAVQGVTDTSPLAGMVVEIEGIVVGDLQGANEYGGLFVQEEDADNDADPLTSEGVFVFTDLPAAPGDLVRARGTVQEFFGLTELSPTSDLVVCDTGVTPPTPAMPMLPLTDPNEYEAIESMSIVMPQALVINDVFNLFRFGEMTLSSQRRMQPTAVVAPGAPANMLAAAHALDALILDDRRDGQNLVPPVNGQDDSNPLAADNPVRNGQTITGLTGVMHYSFGSWRVQPTSTVIIDEGANLRTAAPGPVGGTLRVSSFNVLNFFTTIDTGAPVCGPMMNQDCRGADSPEEYTRQLDKLVPAIIAIDADVLGLNELENNASDSLQALVDAVNAVMGAGTYDFINTGTIGDDAIKVGIIYKPASVTPEGGFALLTSAVDPRFNDALNRPALAQSFRATSNLALFTPIVNHLKSKGCGGATGADEDQGDGQACFNATRTSAAEALGDWANADPTGTGSDSVMILGDLNSYFMEDPIQALQARGFTSLEQTFNGMDSYTFVFFGLAGSLDYALSSAAVTPKVTGAVPWHNNSDETRALDYNTEFGVLPSFYAPTAYRASDHDPIVVGLDLNPPSSLTIPTLADGVDAFIEVTTPTGDKCGFSAAEFVDPNSMAALPPANLEFPYGVLQFTVERCSVGTTATINVTLPSIPDFLAWLKHTATGGWDIYPHVLVDSTFSFDVTDGGMGDEDGVANGVIVDPSGPAVVVGGGERATFHVTKDFDDNNPAEVTVTLSCNTGLPLEQSTMIAEGGHVEFVVGDFIVGTLNCSVSEDVPTGYTPAHNASLGYLGIAGSVVSGDTACEYIEISNGQFLCHITNTLQEVEVTVFKEWIDDNPEYNLPQFAHVELNCSQAGFIGGQYITPAEPGVFSVFPHYDGETCVVTEEPEVGVLADLEDCDGLYIEPGLDAECTVVNTRLYAGIPTLSQYGLLVLSLLMLLIGVTAVRRFV